MRLRTRELAREDGGFMAQEWGELMLGSSQSGTKTGRNSGSWLSNCCDDVLTSNSL